MPRGLCPYFFNLPFLQSADKMTKRLILLLLVVCPGCMLVPPAGRHAQPAQHPYAAHDAEDVIARIGPWWDTFEDPRLNAMIRLCLTNNRDLKAAVSRVGQARAVLRQSAAARWPQVDLSASARRARTLLYAGPAGQVVADIDQYGLSAGAAYEVDLWRRVDASIESARHEFEAAEFDVDAVAMSLSASVAETWFALNERLANAALLDEQLAVANEHVELVELRFEQGLASALDIYQQKQQAAAIRALVPKVRSQAQVLEHSLSVLIGRPPRDGETLAPEHALLPQLNPSPALDLPGDLIDTRPDIKAALARFSAAERGAYAAKADRFPSLALSGRVGYQSEELSTLFDDVVSEIAATLNLPLVDGGGRHAEVDRMQAVREERRQTYSQAVLRALEEVRNALVQEREQQAYIERLDEQLDLADKTLVQSRDRYARGLTDYLNVLTALTSKQQLERDVLSARRELLSYRIQFHRAVGGKLPRDAEDQ